MEKPICAMCGRKYEGKYLVGMGNYYSYGKSDHMMRYCPMMSSQGRENAQAQESAPNPDAPKKNHFYALRSRGNQEDSPDVVTGMLQVFSNNVYVLLDLGANFSFVTPLISKRFGVLPEALIEPFLVITPVGDSG